MAPHRDSSFGGIVSHVLAEDAKLGVSFARGEVWPEDAESGQTGPK